jgi:hypothetical protein
MNIQRWTRKLRCHQDLGESIQYDSLSANWNCRPVVSMVLVIWPNEADPA